MVPSANITALRTPGSRGRRPFRPFRRAVRRSLTTRTSPLRVHHRLPRLPGSQFAGGMRAGHGGLMSGGARMTKDRGKWHAFRVPGGKGKAIENRQGASHTTGTFLEGPFQGRGGDTRISRKSPRPPRVVNLESGIPGKGTGHDLFRGGGLPQKNVIVNRAPVPTSPRTPEAVLTPAPKCGAATVVRQIINSRSRTSPAAAPQHAATKKMRSAPAVEEEAVDRSPNAGRNRFGQHPKTAVRPVTADPVTGGQIPLAQDIPKALRRRIRAGK